MPRCRALVAACALALISRESAAQEVSAQKGANEEEMATVVVPGARQPHVASEPEVASTVFSEQELQEPGVDAPAVLSRSAGVQVNRSGSSADLSTISIRGSSGAQVPVYLAGVRLNDDVVGVADLSRVPLWMLHRAEVYRSATPLHASRSSMSGAVLFEPKLPRHTGVRARATAGSFGTGAIQVGGSLRHPEGKTRSHGATSVSYRRDGAQNHFKYKDDRGTGFLPGDDGEATRYNADFVQDDLWLISRHRVGLKQGAVGLTVFANGLKREQGVTGLSLIPAAFARSRLGRGLVGVSVSAPCGSSTLECTVKSRTGILYSRLRTMDPEHELNLGATSVDQKSARLTQQVGVDLRLSPVWKSGLSGVYETSSLATGLEPEEGQSLRAHEARFAAIGSLGAQATEALLLRGEARVSCLSGQGGSSDALSLTGESFETEISLCRPEARLGVAYEVTPQATLRATGIRGLRFPTLGERYGVSAAVRGNPDLGAEQAWAADVGGRFDGRIGRQAVFWVDASLFARFADQLIAYERSALGYVRPNNIGEARFLGGELVAELSAWQHLRLRSGITGLAADNTTDPDMDLKVPYRSPLTSVSELELWRACTECRMNYLGVSTYANYRSGRYVDPAGLIVIPGQFVVSLAARAEFYERVELQARIDNLFGVTRFDTLGFPQPERSFFLSLGVQGP